MVIHLWRLSLRTRGLVLRNHRLTQKSHKLNFSLSLLLVFISSKTRWFFFYFRKVPSLLEYFSYLFHYSTILAGPVCTFKEFNDFIDGSDIRPKVLYCKHLKKLSILCLTDQRQKTKQQNYKSARKSQSFQMRGRTCRFWNNRGIALSLFLFPLILEAWRKRTLAFGKIVLSWSFKNFTWLEARAFIPLCVSCHSASDGCFKENVVWFLVCGYFIPDWGTLSDI